MRRASEQMMMANLKLLVKKQQHRRAGRRQDVNAAGADFTFLYAQTVDILEKHLVLKPPQRRHSSFGVRDNIALLSLPQQEEAAENEDESTDVDSDSKSSDEP